MTTCYAFSLRVHTVRAHTHPHTEPVLGRLCFTLHDNPAVHWVWSWPKPPGPLLTMAGKEVFVIILALHMKFELFTLQKTF